MTTRYNKAELTFLVKHSCKDACRENLNVIQFDNARGVAVATDGHRLGFRYSEPDVSDSIQLPLNIPRSEVEAIAKSLDKDQTASFDSGGVTVWASPETQAYWRPVKVADVKFPPYDQVLPTSFPENTGVVGISAAYLKDAMAVAKLAGGLGVEIITSSELDPVTICARGESCTYAVVIMPMRLGGKDQRESVFFDMMNELKKGDARVENKAA